MGDKESNVYLKEEFVLDNKSNEIWKRTLISNRRIEKTFSISEIEELIYKEGSEVFIRAERDCLDPIKKDKLIECWNNDFKYHLCIDGECSVDDFENGYFYIPEVWKLKFGKTLIIFSYHH